jgi:ferredoxin
MKTHKIVLHFSPKVSDKPIVVELVRQFGLTFNILKGQINQAEEGYLVLELSGDDASYDRGIEFLKKQGIKIQPLSKDITRDEDKCVHCTACTNQCPTEALHIKDAASREVGFDNEKCIVCEACVAACPFNAMKIQF